MPIRTNRFYNDPNVGAAFENIASIFAPPSAQDTAAYAAARAKNEESKRLSWLFDNPMDATASERSALIGVQNFGATPDGFSATNATVQRGQDIDSGDRRYNTDVGATVDRRGQDINATTARANNAADNARAVATSQLAGIASLYDPVAENAVRPALPAGIAARFGVDGAIPEAAGRVGPMSADEVIGQAIAAMPRETVEGFARDKYAPTESQVQGQERRELRASGALDDQDLVDSIMGAQSPVQAVGPDGKTPIFLSPGEAVREGATPFLNKGAEAAPKVENWTGPDGAGGIAVFDRAANQFIDTVTKQPLPAGSRTYTGQLTGGSEQTGFGKTTEAQDRNAYAATMAEEPTNRLLKAFDTKQLPSTSDYLVFNAMKVAPTAAAPALVGQMSESGQLFYQDLRTALPFQLMTQSGAAVTEQEYDRKLLELIPVPGEADGVTRAKREQFATYIKAVRGVSGAAYDKIHAGGGIKAPALPGSGAPPALASSAGDDPLSAARAAIARGADREAVLQRLRENGVDPGSL